VGIIVGILYIGYIVIVIVKGVELAKKEMLPPQI
jgi:hypothetical protein